MFERKDFFQRSDWVIRPLIKEMIEYAAHDSYFMLTIAYQQIKAKNDNKATIDWIKQ